MAGEHVFPDNAPSIELKEMFSEKGGFANKFELFIALASNKLIVADLIDSEEK